MIEISPELFENPIMLSISTLISEDLAFLMGLVAIQVGKLSSYSFLLFYTFGIIVGDIGLYGIGVFIKHLGDKPIGKKILKFLPKAFFNQKDVSGDFDFGKFETFLIFTRFLPGTRIPTYSYCGLSNYPLWKFTSLLLFSTIVYASVGVLLITLFKGYDLESTSTFMKFLNALFVSFFTIFIFKFILLLRNLKTNWGEISRPLWILIKRLKYPEFWPLVLFYLPLVPSFIFNLIRYKGFSGVLVSNPLIEMSGLIGELKSDIDKVLKEKTPENRLHLHHFTKSDDHNHEQIITQSGLQFPMIIKPDSGMRGTGVELINDLEEFSNYLKTSKNSLVLQEYFSYKNEWGVFYYRYPGEACGHIFSITNKEFPKVCGDGKSNIKELLWKNHFIGCRFNWLYESVKDKLSNVPALGEEVFLTSKGSHSKGCIFKDGADLLTKEIEKSLIETFDKIEGFYIGRIDIRFKSMEELAKGKFKILEINGTGGESSNYYDPQMSYLNVYKTMISQWNLAFKIGDLNLKQKIPKKSLFQFFKVIIKYRNGDA